MEWEDPGGWERCLNCIGGSSSEAVVLVDVAHFRPAP